MTIRGKVMEKSDYVIVYISEIGGDFANSILTKVGKDGTFQSALLLPKKPGKYAFIIAKGQGFNTQKFPTLALIEKGQLFYPTLPISRYRINPLINTSSENPSIILPDMISGNIILRQ